MTRVVSDTLLWAIKEIYSYLRKTYKMYAVINKYNLRRRHLLVNCRSVIRIVIYVIQQYWWRDMNPWIWLEGIEHWSLPRQRLLLIQNRFTGSKKPRSGLIPRLVVAAGWRSHCPRTHYYQSQTQLWNLDGLRLKSGSGFSASSAFFKDA